MTGYCNCSLEIEMSDHWWNEYSFGTKRDLSGFQFSVWYVKNFSYEQGVLYKNDVPLFKRQVDKGLI
tara:strand:+ start:1619 stop:1819 length:201 start_codon:yes stop_codon:yes gene_type:complete